MNWLIQNDVLVDEDKTIQRLKNGRSVELFSDPNDVGEIKIKTILRGSIESAKILQGTPNLKVVVDFPKYDYSYFADHFEDDVLLNPDFRIFTADEFKKYKLGIFEKFGCRDFINDTDRSIIFIRPNGSDKKFDGQVIDDYFLEPMIDYLDRSNFTDVVVSTPKNIKHEYRFLIKYDYVCCGTKYITDGVIKSERVYFGDEVGQWLQGVIETSSYRPNDLFIIDVAELQNGEYRIIETNGFSTSSLYEMDRNQVISAVELTI